MFIPVIDTVLEMTPIDFEKYALQILESKTKGLDNVKFENLLISLVVS